MKIDLPEDLDPETAAHDAGLRYMSDDRPGITRMKKGAHFAYKDENGKVITNQETLKRIESLVIPPAWTDVWICPSYRGHIQATGRDTRGRKQYRYHAKWRELRNKTKYDKLVSFGFVLPSIRRRVFEDLERKTLSEEKILATVVRLLDVTHMRIGNEEYARDNHSYGLTTLRSKHVNVDGSTVHFSFRGKSGVEQEIEVHDRRLARIIHSCLELPGHELFRYVDASGNKVPVNSEHVNAYIQDTVKEEFTAKDFRTWGGTIQAAESLMKLGDSEDAKQLKTCLVCAVKDAAALLGNRPATCRKYYIDPRIFEAYEARKLCRELERFLKQKAEAAPDALQPIEKGVHHILQKSSDNR